MSQQEELRPKQAAIVTCPNCRVAMRLSRAEPLLFASDVLEMVYECPKCHAETKRRLKAPKNSL